MTNTESSNEELAERLAQDFLVNNWTWTFPEGHRNPDKDDFLEAFKNLKETTPEGSFQIMGRLVAVHWNGHLDIYQQVGELI